MKKITILLLSFLSYACNQKDAPEEATKSAEPLAAAVGTTILGTYEGTIPCNSCDGVLMTLTLEDNPAEGSRTYSLTEVYLGEPQPENTFKSDGSWEILVDSPKYPGLTVYHLNPNKTTDTLYFEKISDTEIRLMNRQSINKELSRSYHLVKQEF